jgi:hypothetical protein
VFLYVIRLCVHALQIEFRPSFLVCAMAFSFQLCFASLTCKYLQSARHAGKIKTLQASSFFFFFLLFIPLDGHRMLAARGPLKHIWAANT